MGLRSRRPKGQDGPPKLSPPILSRPLPPQRPTDRARPLRLHTARPSGVSAGVWEFDFRAGGGPVEAGDSRDNQCTRKSPKSCSPHVPKSARRNSDQHLTKSGTGNRDAAQTRPLLADVRQSVASLLPVFAQIGQNLDQVDECFGQPLAKSSGNDWADIGTSALPKT